MAVKTLRHASIEPAHPGEFLAEITIPATGKSKAEIARLLGVSRQTLYDVLGRKQAVTPDLAVRLGKLFGDGAMIWLRMQQSYDLWHAERRLAEEIAKMPTLNAAA
jgi:addiction module HigA family antidote